mgnify:CR=1 FL=1
MESPPSPAGPRRAWRPGAGLLLECLTDSQALGYQHQALGEKRDRRRCLRVWCIGRGAAGVRCAGWRGAGASLLGGRLESASCCKFHAW